MWGYVEDTGGTCFGAADDGARLTCIAGLPDPTLPDGENRLIDPARRAGRGRGPVDLG